MHLNHLSLSAKQAQAFKKSYSAGEVQTEVLFNLMHAQPHCPAMGLELLPVPFFDPVHFHFVGNRPYCMQLVGNEECVGILSHQKVSKKERDDPCFNMVRLELLMGCNLPFLKVAPPTQAQVRQVYADFLQYCVTKFEEHKPRLPEQIIEMAVSRAQGGGLMGRPADPATSRILAGEDPRVVLQAWIEPGLGASLPDPAPRSTRP